MSQFYASNIGVIAYYIGSQKKHISYKPESGTYTDDYVTVFVKKQKQTLGYCLQVKLYPKQDITFSFCKFYWKLPKPSDTSHIFCNGFQSWTQSREWSPNYKIKPIHFLTKSLMKAYGDYYFLPDKKSLHSWNYTFLRPQGYANSNIVFAGSLNEKWGYTLFEYLFFGEDENACHIGRDAKGLSLKKEQTWLALDLYIGEGEEQQIFQEYFASANTPKLKVKPAIGWTSWYNYYTTITEKIVLDNLQAFATKNIPIQIFQIDDGWQGAVGDWLVVNDKFPSGMKALAAQIKKRGFTPGLWLAPFMCEKKSNIYKKHKNWLLQTEKGKPQQSGFNIAWKGWSYALDFYNPEVRTYLTEVFDTVLNKWGFEMVKLDFLYCAAMSPPPDKTRGQVMYEVMQWLRDTVGDKIILGCGVPLGTSFGLVDYCRIGADVHLTWDIPIIKWLGSRERVSTINSMKNTIFRRQMDGQAFWNDPDVSMLRDTNLKLNEEQRYSLFFVNQLFGSLQFVSDNIEEYTPATLELYQSQFPFKTKQIKAVSVADNLFEVHFVIKNLTYIAFCNLHKQERTVKLPIAEDQYWFNNRTHEYVSGGESCTLVPFQSVCFLKVEPSKVATIAGSSGHLFSGSEVASLETVHGDIVIEVEEEVVNDTKIFVRLPQAYEVSINGRSYLPSKVDGMNIVVYEPFKNTQYI